MNKVKHIQIKLLGIGSVKDQELRANLMAAIESLAIKVEVIEVSDIEELLNYGITGIPALLLGEEILFQKTVPSVDEIYSVLLKKHLEFSSTSNGLVKQS